MSGSTTEIISRGITTLLEFFWTGRVKSQHDAWAQLVEDQQGFGTRVFFAGLWINHWNEYQKQYLEDNKSRKSAQLWFTRLVQKVHSTPLNLWKTRNAILHRTADNYIGQEQNQELDVIIDTIFTQKPHSWLMPHCDGTYFTKHGIDKIKNMKTQ